MRPLLIIGVLLIAFGIVSLGYEGFTYVSREKVAEVGPFEINANRQRTIWFSPLAGVIALAAGAGLILAGTRRSTA